MSQLNHPTPCVCVLNSILRTLQLLKKISLGTALYHAALLFKADIVKESIGIHIRQVTESYNYLMYVRLTH